MNYTWGQFTAYLKQARRRAGQQQAALAAALGLGLPGKR